MAEQEQLKDPELLMLINNIESGYNVRRPRQPEWRENYSLYRNRVMVNRLTQRQTINVPLMKMLIRTLLSDVDDMPFLHFENLDNDKQAELFQNEYWKYTVKCNRMELQDVVDKRQVFLFGRSFDQWQIVDGEIKQTVQDPQDILVSRFCDPFNIHSSRFLIHTHIFIPLSKLKKNKDYDQAKIAAIEEYFKGTDGIIKAADNQDMYAEKSQKMQDMGVPDVQDPVLGETYVELRMHFVFRNDEKDSAGNAMDEQIFLYVEAENREILMKKPLEEVIGVTKDHYWRDHYPYVSWADDLERQAFWSDGAADIIRNTNIVLNSYISQIVENRTLRSLNMHYYNSSSPDFQPNTFNPIPWGWYPVPGNPNELIKDVEVPALTDSLNEMTFLLEMAEKATGATATAQGAPTERKITLGEVQLALGQAQERIKGMSKFYTPAWEQRGEIFIKLIEAAPDKLDAVKIYKKGKTTTKMYGREIAPSDWMTENGYSVRIWSQDQKDAQDADKLQKLNAVRQLMPGNPKVEEIVKMNLLEFADLNPEQISEVMDFERHKQDMMAQQAATMGQPGAQPGVAGPPQQQLALPANVPQGGQPQ